MESPRKILERLEELRKWQEEQEKLLIAKQSHQRKLLAQEQSKLYEMLGCLSPRNSQVTSQEGLKNRVSGDGEFIERLSSDSLKKSSLIAKPSQEATKRSPVNKKPFLRRGEGLTSRFRVNPDHFNLRNVPKYKYSLANKRAMKQNKENVEKVPEGFPAKKTDRKSPKKDESTETLSNKSPQKPQADGPTERSWANLLEAMNLDPEKASQLFQDFVKMRLNTSLESFNKGRGNGLDDLSIFELLEEKLQNSSFSSNSSTVRRLLKYDEARTEEIPPKAEEDPKPIPESTDEESEEEIPPRKHQVRFCEKVEVNQFSDSSSEEEDQEGNMVSTPQKSEDEFLDFKVNLERKLAKFSDSGSEGDSREELLTKRSEEVKERLRELEEEIEKFRNQNIALTKEKQIHELSKVDLENRRLELEDQINDERIKMELYFHDERMKIANDKARYEKLLKDFKVPTKKEREEIKKLKEKIEELEKELKDKIAKHGAAQSRHRSQIRGLEKEIKEQGQEIEQLKKENRKLEAENVRLRRQSNNKTLQEIKRNIAKLAPAATSSPPVQEPSGQLKKKSPAANQARGKRLEAQKSIQLDDDLYSSDLSSESDEEDDTPRNELPPEKRLSGGSQDSAQKMDLKREIVNSDGSRDIWYPNGNLKKISADGMLIRMLYFNKDIKETDFNGGTVKYYYAESNTWHTSYLDGLEIYEYPK